MTLNQQWTTGFVVAGVLVFSSLRIFAQERTPEGVDADRIAQESQAGLAARRDLETARAAYQHLIDCIQNGIRNIDARLERTRDERARAELTRRRQEWHGRLNQWFRQMRQTLSGAEEARSRALMTCAQRHAEDPIPSGQERTTVIVRRMDSDSCSPEMGALSEIPLPAAQLDERLCRDQ